MRLARTMAIRAFAGPSYETGKEKRASLREGRLELRFFRRLAQRGRGLDTRSAAQDLRPQAEREQVRVHDSRDALVA